MTVEDERGGREWNLCKLSNSGDAWLMCGDIIDTSEGAVISQGIVVTEHVTVVPKSELTAANLRAEELTKRLEEADLRNKLLLKTNKELAEELEEAEEREQRLREALRIALDGLGCAHAEDAVPTVRSALSQQEPG